MGTTQHHGNNEWEEMWTEVVVAYFKFISVSLPKGLKNGVRVCVYVFYVGYSHQVSKKKSVSYLKVEVHSTDF